MKCSHDNIIFDGQSDQVTLTTLALNDIIFIDLPYLDQNMVKNTPKTILWQLLFPLCNLKPPTDTFCTTGPRIDYHP